MTEARGYLQKAPREGAADLVACASVTASSLPLARSLCVDLLTFLAKLHSPEPVEGSLVSVRETEQKGKRKRERKEKEEGQRKEEDERKRLVAASSDLDRKPMGRVFSDASERKRIQREKNEKNEKKKKNQPEEKFERRRTAHIDAIVSLEC